MTGVTRSIIINAPREEVFDVISDFEGYPRFLSGMEDVTIEKSSSKEMIVSFTLNMIKKINYTLKIRLSKPNSLSWTLVKGDGMAHNNGSWKLKKLSARKTEAVYSIDVGLGPLVPGYISKMLVEGSLPAMLNGFKKRIEGSKRD